MPYVERLSMLINMLEHTRKLEGDILVCVDRGVPIIGLAVYTNGTASIITKMDEV
jgi:hypothetical protein